ncbi:hypothetical protein [Desulfosporosinus sp. Sb-LF]|uniref:hypothetical protein n=1 Tax=Desulfosporosinus sp. Sb-LF TaxID=2560027 RepID=UPI001FB18D66|nr:hypothetical protein [Desulfosporosinus sp. Sb-LF]
MEQAHNVLLGPYYDVKLKVDLEHIGRVLSDIQKSHDRFSPHEVMGNKSIVTGRVPVASFMNYSAELASFTQGRGMISLSFGGYERCHNEDEIIQQRGYRKDADPSYSSSSVFCSKGQTYVVPLTESDCL